MKITIFALLIAGLIYYTYKTATYNPAYKSCQIFASIASEKMWQCGMLRYDKVASMRDNLFNTFTELKISATECTDDAHLIELQTCQQYEMMVSQLVYNSQKASH